MKKLIKTTSVLLVIFLLASLFYGCSKNDNVTSKSNSDESTTKQEASSTQQSNTNTNDSDKKLFGGLKLPIVDKPITLTYFVPNSYPTVLKTYNDIKMYQIQEKDTGIHIEFIHPPAGQETDQLNLLIASNDLPDIIETNPLTYPGGPEKLLQDNVAVEIQDLIDKYAPNFKNLFVRYPEVKKQISTDAGKMYCFPWLNFYDVQLVYMGHIIREDWLNNLSLEMPQTIDDWYNILTAFKERDPNGNGEKDEIPYIAIKYERLDPFCYAWGLTSDFYVENGNIKYGAIEPRFKDYLSTMRKWYSEGLIDPDYASTDSKQFDSKATSNIGGAFYGYSGGQIRTYMTLMEQNDPNYKLAGTRYPVLERGQKPPIGHRINMFYGGGSALITGSNKYVKETVHWLDYNYSPKGHMLCNYGIEGESYVMDNGYPRYTDNIAKTPNGFIDELTKYTRFVGNGPWENGKEAQIQYMAHPASIQAIENWSQTEKGHILPPITPTQEDSLRLNSIMNEINTYKSEMLNKFIMGQEPLDKYDDFVSTLRKMNIEKAIKIQQSALDRYNKR